MLKLLTVWVTKNCGKFLKWWDYQTTLLATWETCFQVRKQQLEPDVEQWIGSKLGKEYIKAVYCHPAYLIYMQSTSWECRLIEAQAGIKIAKGNINNLRHSDVTTLMAKREEKLKSLLMKVKEEGWKNWLKTQHSRKEAHGILSHHFMECRWGNNGKSDRLSFFGSQNHCRWWLQPWN